MPLSNDLISRFVKITNDSKKTKNETVVYGTISTDSRDVYVTIDGADYSKIGGVTESHNPKVLVTNKSVTEVKDGDRVTVLIKNHTAIITGNIDDPSTNKGYTDTSVGAVALDLENFKAKAVTTEQLDAKTANIKQAVIDEVDARYIKTDELDADKVNAGVAKIETIEADNVKINETLSANSGKIEDLETKKLSAEDAALTYANIDFSNIDKATMEYFYAMSGLIKDVVVGEATITGELVGVTIKGDLIEGGTVVADKLVIKGEDGLYYKLNTDGVTTESEQTEYNSINGNVILAQSITATKISVDDLVAFDATIGGFNITTEAIYSGVKESVDNTTSGVYLDKEGQFALGDGDNFLRYYKDDEGIWRLEISAASVLFGANSKSSAEDIKALTDHVKIGTYTDPGTGETKPCVELSEGDINFKQVITNTSTMFMDGSQVRTEIDTEGISSENVTVKDEIRHGNFVWKTRSNGNMGLVWKGGSN